MQPLGKPVLPEVYWMLISVPACTSVASTGVSGALSTMPCQLADSPLPVLGERGRVRGGVRGGGVRGSASSLAPRGGRTGWGAERSGRGDVSSVVPRGGERVR